MLGKVAFAGAIPLGFDCCTFRIVLSVLSVSEGSKLFVFEDFEKTQGYKALAMYPYILL